MWHFWNAATSRNRGLPILPALVILVAATALPALPAGAQVEEIDDDRITLAVETELIVDEAVPAHLIDVETNDGILRLDGSVDNILARDRAEQIARATKGVRSVINDLVIRPVDRADAEVRADVVEALALDPATESYELEVIVENGVVTLEGSAQSWQEKQLAEEVAKGVRGVTEIENEIAYEYEEDRPDREIQQDIERRLETDVMVDAGLIDVQVSDGRVKLTGAVGSAAERSNARIDAWVAGVKSVDVGDLETEWWTRDEMRRRSTYVSLTDAKVEEAIRDAFFYDPRVSSFAVEVNVDDGVAVLRGTVSNLRAKQAAEDDAQNTVGVWRVRNHVRVRPEDQPEDAVLAERVREALRRDPYVERHELTVSVINGKTYLYGTADSAFERSQATVVASGVSGVIEVDNNVRVQGEMPYKTDLELRQDVESQLYWSPFVDEEDITVTASDGTVTLSGSADSWLEWRQAEQNARDAGARRVRNRLKIGYGPAP